MPRPYIKLGINELYDLFEKINGDLKSLKDLYEELGHRKSKAKNNKLKEKVASALKAFGEISSNNSIGNKPENKISSTTNSTVNKNPTPSSHQNKNKRDLFDAQSKPQLEKSFDRTSQDNVQPSEYLSDSFCLIEPIGVSGRPSKWVFERKKDIKLQLTDDSPLSERYTEALRLLITEMRKKHTGENQFTLEEGVRIALDRHENVYQFTFEEEMDAFEGAVVTAYIDNQTSSGRIVGLVGKSLIISLDDDFGTFINKCVLSIDNTAMLEALAERLSDITEKSSEISFNSTIAKSVVENLGDENSAINDALYLNAEGLNRKQLQAIQKSLSNDVFYIWGPPGSGKTKILSNYIEELFTQDKRILICSNTNKAVDQVLLKLCKKFGLGHEAIVDGRIVRVGKIAHNELQQDWGDYITLDGILERKLSELKQQKLSIEERLNKLEHDSSSDRKLLDYFKRHDLFLSEQEKLVGSFKTITESLSIFNIELAKEKKRRQGLNDELAKLREAGVIRRLVMRAEEVIVRDQATSDNKINTLHTKVNEALVLVEKVRESLKNKDDSINRIKVFIKDLSKEEIEKRLRSFDEEITTLKAELSDITRKLDELAKSIMANAKIVGATVAKAYLSPKYFNHFDIVIIDEVSMVLLPSLYYVSGLAKEKVLISGDFRQLSPIVQTDQEEVYELIGKDVFSSSGIEKAVISGSGKRLVMLDEQYRMDASICRLISGSMYRGYLKTATVRVKDSHNDPIAPYNDPLIIVDTSRIWPFCNKDPFKSKYNLIHALAIRNLCFYLNKHGFIQSESSLGICTPYAAQSKILRRILKSDGLLEKIDAGTVHRYQGDEKNMMVLDITDSIGEYNAGYFLQADLPEESGSRLFNVAVSRAKEHLVVFANLTWLDQKLPGNAILRGILYEMQTHGTRIDVRDVIAYRPITEDLRKYGRAVDIDIETEKTGLFKQSDFEKVAYFDMSNAKKSIAIFSGFITPKRVAKYEVLFRSKIAEGVKIRCVTRPPKHNGNMAEDLGKEAIAALIHMGCIVDLRWRIHEKAVLIDDEITWSGSLNPLSHTASTDEVMLRTESPELTIQLSVFLSLHPKSVDSAGALSVEKENPECPQCGLLSVYRTGRYGAYWECSDQCGWKESFRKGEKKRTKNKIDLTKYNVPSEQVLCPKCGSEMKVRSSRYGPFLGCSKFPACKGNMKINKKQKVKGL